MKAVLDARNVLVVFIGVVLAAVFLVAGLVPMLQEDSFEEDVPFPSVSEFPFADETDKAAMMELAAAFLESPDWSEDGVSIEGWGLADVAPLTRGGEGIGIYADVRFERQLSLRGPLSFIRCGQREIWVSPAGELGISGLRIWLFDVESQPYHVLPLNQYGELPKLRDVKLFVATPADCPGLAGSS